MKARRIYDGSIQDLRSRRPQECWGTYAARAKLIIASLSLQSVGQHHTQGYHHLHQLRLSIELDLPTKQRSIAEWKR